MPLKITLVKHEKKRLRHFFFQADKIAGCYGCFVVFLKKNIFFVILTFEQKIAETFQSLLRLFQVCWDFSKPAEIFHLSIRWIVQPLGSTLGYAERLISNSRNLSFFFLYKGVSIADRPITEAHARLMTRSCTRKQLIVWISQWNYDKPPP